MNNNIPDRQTSCRTFCYLPASFESITCPVTIHGAGCNRCGTGLKRPHREADYSHPSSAKAKNAWSHISSPAIRLHGVALLLVWRYSLLCALASLMSLLHRSLSYAVLNHAVTVSILRSFNTECSHLSLGLPFFLLPSGWEKVIFLQGALSSILAVCPSWRGTRQICNFTSARPVW
jgi:hypothetical protein